MSVVYDQYKKFSTVWIWIVMLKSFGNSKHFSICSGMNIPSMVYLPTKIHFRVEIRFCSTFPRALALVSVCTLCYVLWELSNISSMGVIITQCFSCWNSVSYDSTHAKLVSFHINECKGSEILLNPLIDFQKNYTNQPKNNYTYYMVVSFGHSVRLHTFS